MAHEMNISVDGTPLTPDNTVVNTDENGNGTVEVKKDEAPAEPEDPLPLPFAETAQSTDTTTSNCVQ